MGITHDQFIRTTSPAHARGVQKLFTTLYEKGFIYLASYTGSYCVSDEAFIDAPVGTPCPDCGRLLEEVTEENFFFKLSAFQAQLIDLIESNTLLITPDSSRNEVLSFLRGGLKDLSISRSSFTWGIPVPEPAASTAAQKHVIYVWLDALANYMTALGYGSDDETLFQKFWPADLHLVGKEITRFHCIYWPAFLLAAGIDLPKQITAHGWLLFDNSKMSKSKGNIVRTETILSAFGTLCPPPATGSSSGLQPAENAMHEKWASAPADSRRGTASAVPSTAPKEGALAPEVSPHDRDLFAADVLRYYLLREIPFGQDGSFSFEALITRYNADLANGYGNLVSRTLSMIGKYFAGIIPERNHQKSLTDIINDFELPSIADAPNTQSFTELVESISTDSFARNDFFVLLRICQMGVAAADQMLTRDAPWKKDQTTTEGKREAEEVLYTAAESIRIITALLHPILPYATARVWAQLGLGDIEQAAKNGQLKDLQWGGLKPGTKLGPLGPIFPRADKGLAQTMADNEETLTTDSSQPKTVNQKPSQDSSSPDAPPRTSTLPEPALTVAGSHAHTTGPDPTVPPPAATPAPTTDTPQITIDDFAKIELRVAQITLAERIPKADKLLRLEVDLGQHGQRQILSGIAEFYTPEELIGRRIVVITNLAPRKMRGLESHGMLLAASDGDHGKPHLATCGEDIPLGSRLK
jgi:methionyl-tRNA synthetase